MSRTKRKGVKYMKRWKSLLVSGMMLFGVLCTPSQSVCAMNNLEESSTVLNSELLVSDINQIDSLIEKRTAALINGNEEQYEYLDERVRATGTEEVSLEEILSLTGASNTTKARSPSTKYANSIKYEKTTYKYRYSDGKTYSVMKITATPTGEGLLYKTGSTTIKNSSSAAANAMQFIKIGASSVAGIASNKISIAQTVYSALAGGVSQLSSKSTITKIKANYTWNTSETCSYIYIYDKSLGSYRLGARYHKVSSGIGASVPTLTIKNKGSVAVVNQRSYSGSATPVNYDSVSQAIKYYKKKAVYTSSITKVDIKGVEGKTVRNVRLANPQTPSEAGYH